ncbi:MAG: NUDIX hydrolase [Gammaproteobacteria bacterium]|nr:NUDIX hydrolase [Gammaproteobacteria bacterium]
MKRLVLESVDWINIVALTPNEESVMVRQFRFGIGACTLETPGGMVDEGETPLEAAQRELLEETGYSSNDWSYLGAVEPNPAFHPHLCHHFLARNVVRVADLDLGPGEAIEIEVCDLDRLRDAMRDGSLRHSLALSALSRVYPLWQLPHTQIFDTVTRL